MSILPHNNTKWYRDGLGQWYCYPTPKTLVALVKVGEREYIVQFRPYVHAQFEANSYVAAKAEALRLVREAVLAEAEAWK